MAVKAYAVTENVHREASKLVFAETAEAAKSKAFKDEIFDNVEYTDLRVTRAKFADGQEDKTERELLVLCLRNGWWTENTTGEHITSENVDEAIRQGWI